MNNVIPFKKNKKPNNPQKAKVNSNTEGKYPDNFEDRLNRIRQSICRIDALMQISKEEEENTKRSKK